jgi:hypothetical protein
MLALELGNGNVWNHKLGGTIRVTTNNKGLIQRITSTLASNMAFAGTGQMDI